MDVTYVVPIRCSEACDGHGELRASLLALRDRGIEVIVADGSRELPAHRGFGAFRHLDVRPRPGGNGKVAGVVVGVEAATCERVVIGDDDVRYDRATLAEVAALLDDAELVVPQNHFVGWLPWHAVWDTSRTLLNRAFGHDYPGTLAIRRSWFVAIGGYGDTVLFENLELIRTVRAWGGRVRWAPDVYVPRLPPSLRGFANQRVRQAYDDLAQPARLAAELSIAPLVVAGARRPLALAAGTALIVAAAELGRRRGHGASRFPAAASLMAPLWLLERAICVWVAVGVRVTRGGIRYRGTRLRTAANPIGAIRRRRNDVVRASRASRRTAASSASARIDTTARRPA